MHPRQVVLGLAQQSASIAAAALGMHAFVDDLEEMVRSCLVQQYTEVFVDTMRKSDNI